MTHLIIDSPSLHLSGCKLPGFVTKQDWEVLGQITRPKGGTGGTFSVGYDVSGPNGQVAYLKATDIGLLRVDPTQSKLDQMTDALNLQRFERDMLNICSGSSMDRIVLALDYGEFEVVHNGVREWVFFIVFEKASGDIRTKAREYRNTGVAWIPRVVHNLAVATSQLHRKNISHNDIKPSNFLVFDMTVQKLADLGRATCASVTGPWDEMPEVGDRTYSAPEAWGYAYTAPMTGSKVHQGYRRSFDIYMLGSLIFFLLTEQSLNRVMATFLRPEYGPSNWPGTFRDIVPYLQNVHSDAMQVMSDEIIRAHGAETAKQLNEISNFARNLTQVDPSKRGDPQNQVSGSHLCDLQRLISRSDILALKLSIKEKI